MKSKVLAALMAASMAFGSFAIARDVNEDGRRFLGRAMVIHCASDSTTPINFEVNVQINGDDFDFDGDLGDSISEVGVGVDGPGIPDGLTCKILDTHASNALYKGVLTLTQEGDTRAIDTILYSAVVNDGTTTYFAADFAEVLGYTTNGVQYDVESYYQLGEEGGFKRYPIRFIRRGGQYEWVSKPSFYDVNRAKLGQAQIPPDEKANADQGFIQLKDDATTVFVIQNEVFNHEKQRREIVTMILDYREERNL
jgi:hypothetical protein